LKKIILLLAGLLLLVLPNCNKDKLSYTVMAGEMSVSIGSTESFTINPAKVHVFEPCVIPVTIHNNSNKSIKVDVESRVADFLAEGYTEVNPDSSYYTISEYGSFELTPNSEYITLVSVDKRDGNKDNKLERWLSFTEVTEAQFKHELCLRILIR